LMRCVLSRWTAKTGQLKSLSKSCDGGCFDNFWDHNTSVNGFSGSRVIYSTTPFVVLPLPVQGVLLAAHAYVRVIRGSGAPGVEVSILVGDAVDALKSQHSCLES
jgi:hypothetical protein